MVRVRNAMKGEMNRRVSRLVYGNKKFTEKMKERFEIDAVIKPNGRPRKDRDKE
jgi:hypothetical protein